MDHLTPLSSSTPPRPSHWHLPSDGGARRQQGQTTVPPLMWRRRNIRAWKAARGTDASGIRGGVGGVGCVQPIKVVVHRGHVLFSLSSSWSWRGFISPFSVAGSQSSGITGGSRGSVIWFSGPLWGEVLGEWNTASREKIAASGRVCVLRTWLKARRAGRLRVWERVSRTGIIVRVRGRSGGKGRMWDHRCLRWHLPEVLPRWPFPVSLLISISAAAKKL